MPLYEFLLRAPGRSDEVRISDHNGLSIGDEITIANRRWIVAARERVTTERRDRIRIEERVIVIPYAASSGATRSGGGDEPGG